MDFIIKTIDILDLTDPLRRTNSENIKKMEKVRSEYEKYKKESTYVNSNIKEFSEKELSIIKKNKEVLAILSMLLLREVAKIVEEYIGIVIIIHDMNKGIIFGYLDYTVRLDLSFSEVAWSIKNKNNKSKICMTLTGIDRLGNKIKDICFDARCKGHIIVEYSRNRYNRQCITGLITLNTIRMFTHDYFILNDPEEEKMNNNKLKNISEKINECIKKRSQSINFFIITWYYTNGIRQYECNETNEQCFIELYFVIEKLIKNQLMPDRHYNNLLEK